MEFLKTKVPSDRTGVQSTGYAAFSSYSIKVLTAIDSQPEVSHAATIMTTSATFLDYFSGGPTPLEAERVTKIKISLSKIRAEGLSGKATLEVLMQIIATFQAYSTLYEAIKNHSIKGYLPFNEVLFPLASLYLTFGKLLIQIKTWEKARGIDKEHASVMQVVGSVASCLLYTAQIVMFLSATKCAITFQAALSSIIYGSMFFQLIHSEFDAQGATQKSDRASPIIRLKV